MKMEGLTWLIMASRVLSSGEHIPMVIDPSSWSDTICEILQLRV